MDKKNQSVQNSNKPQSTFKCAHALSVTIDALLTLYLIESNVFIFINVLIYAHPHIAATMDF